jgi:outer membrane protein OmpA-like peptidoglycan-associated protein
VSCKLVVVLVWVAMTLAFESGCATKKYVRSRIAERVQPLENRTSELEETSRRNTQQISQLSAEAADVRLKADRAQQTADRAKSAADLANNRVASVESGLEDLRTNLDKYSVRATSMVFFRPGSDTLTKEAMAQLDQLAAQITEPSGFVLEITGYGDAIGPARFNAHLAQLRAEAVQRYLVDKDNVAVMRTFALGAGTTGLTTGNVSTSEVSSSPRTATGSQPDRTTSRRVDIKLLTNNLIRNGQPAPVQTGSGVSSQSPATAARR